MQPPIQDLKVIQEAFPHYTPADIWSALSHPEIVEQAKKIVQKNKYTFYCMEELAGFHISRIQDENYQELKVDFNRINPFYKTTFYKKDPQTYSFANILLHHANFENAIRFIRHLSDNHHSATQIRQILDLPSVCKDIRHYIFASPKKAQLPIIRKQETQQKIMFDSCLAEIVKQIGCQALIEDVFKDKISGFIHLDKPYPFESLKQPSLTITDFCLNHQMPQTVIAFLQQTLDQTHDVHALLPFLQGEQTRRHLLAAYQTRRNLHGKPPIAKSLVDYLESVLPTDLFIQTVLQKAPSHQWGNDFDNRNDPAGKSGTATPNQTKTDELKPIPSKPKEFIQSDFFSILQGHPVDR